MVRSDWALIPLFLLFLILPIPGTVALRLLCICLAVVCAALAYRNAPPPSFPAKWGISVWSIVAICSLFYAIDPQYSLSEIKNEIFYTMLAFFSCFVLASDDRSARNLFGALSIGALILCIGVIAGRISVGAWDEAGRFGGTGVFASYLVTVLPAVALAAVYFRRSYIQNLAVAAMTALLIAGFLCLQRIIWPVLFVQLAVVLWFCRGTFRLSLSRTIVVLLAALMLFSLAIVGTNIARFKSEAAPVAEMGADVRLSLWPQVLDQISEQPASGAGFGRRAMSKKQSEAISAENKLLGHAHNVLLNYGLAMGIPGMASLLFLFGALFFEYRRMAQSGEQGLKLIGVCGMAMVVGVFGRNMVNDFFVRDQAILFWMLNGLLLGAGVGVGRRVKGGAAE